MKSGQQSNLAIDPLSISPNLGAEIRGVSLEEALSAEDVNRIQCAFAEHEFLVFRNQAISSRQHLEFARQLGEPMIHPFPPPEPPEFPELVVIQTQDGLKQSQHADIWHSDETFRAEPPSASIVRSVVAPERGGDTLIASMTAAYEGLSDHWQRFLSGLEAVHDIKPYRNFLSHDAKSRQVLREMEERWPNPTHPVVTQHPVSGRKVLFANRQFTIRIKGMTEQESQSVLNFLFEQPSIPENQQRIHWERDTLVMWDNRAVQHYAVYDYYPQPRRMEKITLRGERPVAPA
ncbi:MAG: TauD/TfdA dioxygenase family protein [Myxococcota bacterium]